MVAKFDGVYSLPNDKTLYRIAKITAENRESLKTLIPERAHGLIDNSQENEYLVEGEIYTVINEGIFSLFTKLSDEEASKTLSGGVC